MRMTRLYVTGWINFQADKGMYRYMERVKAISMTYLDWGRASEREKKGHGELN